MDVRQLRFDEIEVADRLRDLDTARLDRIVISMTEVGQMTPIEVMPQAGQLPYRLISGAHRLAAAKLAGLDTINAVIYVGASDPDTLRLREIDENLARADLTAYDRANFIAERARVWEAMNGPIRRGGDRTKAKDQIWSFAFNKDVCERFGIPEREVKRHRARGSRIRPALWAALRGTPAADNGVLLDAAARLSAEDQLVFLERLKPSLGLPEKQFKKAFWTAHKAASGVVPEKTDQQLADALLARWVKLSDAAKEAFRKGQLAAARSERAGKGVA
jgi:hypothetical protein